MKNFWSRFSLVLLLSFFCIFLFSCNSNNQSLPLVIGVSGDTDSFNPLLTRSRFGTELSKMMYLGLMQEQPDFVTFKPGLARSWEMMDNGKRVRFNLRTDVFWTDSVKVSASDVEFTYQKQIDDKIDWPGASVKDRIKSINVINDSTIDFIFDEPYTYQLMDINEGVILPRHVYNHVESENWQDIDFTNNSVTNGPYKLKSWVPNQFIELVNNELYYETGLPKIKHIIFKIVPDKTQLLTQLKTGEVHVMEGVPPQDAVRMTKEKNNIIIEHFPYAQYVQINWNMYSFLFQDKNVRMALTHAIDRQTLVNHLLQGYGQINKSPIHSMLWAYNPELNDVYYSPDEAKQLFAGAGWTDSNGDGYIDKDNTDFEFRLMTNIGSQVREDALVIIQEMLKKVGVRVIPQRLEWSVYVEKLMARDYDAVLIGMMSASKVDVFPVWHSSMCGADGFNLSCYKNKEIDDLIMSARQIVDRQAAIPLWYKLQDIIVNDQPATFLWIPERLVGLESHLGGYQFSPVSTFFNIAEWYRK